MMFMQQSRITRLVANRVALFGQAKCLAVGVTHLTASHSSQAAAVSTDAEIPRTTRLAADVPSLKQFLQAQAGAAPAPTASGGAELADATSEHIVPFKGSFWIETYGCQMNASDSELVVSLLQKGGYFRAKDLESADVVLTNTCAIRDNAEQKVWQRLSVFNAMKKKTPRTRRKQLVGVLGCMAERLKTKLLEAGKGVDLVVGPDAYRDLPRLLDQLRSGELDHGVNVALSLHETYEDVAPVREDPRKLSAFISIGRGCANMCSFCVVPHTRGRERSRPVASIEEEVRRLAGEGYKEVTLLGQNVNSYWDASTPSGYGADKGGYATAAGFSNMYKLRQGEGVRFAELLDRLTALAPGMRFRFTSPHPKDFPDVLLSLMAERGNLCKQVHLPAQSGSTKVLQSMRRGYSREAYLALAHRIREVVPGVALSSDFISGFCGESEEEHAETLSLISDVRFEQAFMFAYSRRERTHAAYHYADDVPQEVKLRRLQEVIATFRAGATARNAEEVGRLHVVLIEGAARRSTPERPQVTGRTDNFKRVLLPDAAIPCSSWAGSSDALAAALGAADAAAAAARAAGISNDDDDGDAGSNIDSAGPAEAAAAAAAAQQAERLAAALAGAPGSACSPSVRLQCGDFAVVRITGSGATSLTGQPVLRLGSGLQDGAWARLQALASGSAAASSMLGLAAAAGTGMAAPLYSIEMPLR